MIFVRRIRVLIPLVLVALAPIAAYAQTFTPELTPTAVTVTAGDPAGATFQAAINHDPGFSSQIRVSFAPLPSGITITPSEQFLNPPYNAVTFTVRAAATAPNGAQNVTVFFTETGQAAKITSLTVNVVGGAPPPPSFEISVAPDRFDIPQGQTRSTTVTLRSLNGFSGTVNFSADFSPALLDVTPPSFPLFVAANGTAAATLNVRALATAPQGSANFILRAQSGTLQDSVGVYPTITAGAPPADFNFAVLPPAGTVTAGQTTSVTTSVTPVNGFSNPVAISVSAPNNAVTASPVTVTSPYSPTPVTLQVAPTAQGAIPVTFTATSGTVVKTTVVTLNVQAAQTPSFDLVVTPTDLAVTVGQSGAVTLRVIPSGGFTGTVTVTAPVITDAGVAVAFNPSTFTLAPNESRAVTVTALPSSRSTSAPMQLQFRGTSGTLTDTATLSLIVAPAAGGDTPVIQAITPMAYAPMPSQEFIVIGRNFAPGAAVSIEQPVRGAIAVAATRFISSTQLGVTLSVTPDAQTGRGYRVTVRNPNGRTTNEPVVLVVAPQGALGGPAAVTRVAIEYPIRGQVIASGKGSIAAAHLATSGSGTVVGRWILRQRSIENDPGYVFDQFTATVAGGYLVSTDRPCFDGAGRPKTTAHVCASIPMLHRGAYRLELVVDQPRLVTPASVPITIQSDSATELAIYTPRESTIDANHPEFSWTTVPGVAQYNVEFVRETTAGERVLPIVFETARSTWTPDLRELRTRRGLTPGTYRWRVVAVYPGDLRGQVSEWRTIRLTDVAFTSARHVATVASADLSVALDQEAETPEEPPASDKTYTFAPNATINGTKNADPTGQFTFSSQGEMGIAGGQSKFTGDLNYNATSDPQRVVQESRNWVLEGGSPLDRTYGVNGQFGYTTPDFTSGAEFLTSGSAQTGVVGHARSRFGTFSYYQPVSTAVHGVMSGLQENLEIRSAAFSTPEGRAYSLRLIALEVEEPSNEEQDLIGSSLRTLGVYGKYDISPAASLVAEFAHGRVRADELTGRTDARSGAAMRVGLTGTRGTFNYSANVRNIGANFVNPANRGLTPGGVSDRLLFDVNLGKTIGQAMLTFGLRRQDQGRSRESTMPKSHQNGLNLGLTTGLAGFSVNVAANYTGDRGEANALTFFPATHRDASGISTSVSRVFGRVNLSQTLNVQRTSDEINPMSDQTLTGAGLTASGTFFTNLTLNGSLNGTRTRAVRELGTTKAWTASFQPTLAIPYLSVSLQPSASFSRSENATLATQSKSEQYNMSLQWSPSFLGSLVAAQLTSSWSRSSSIGFTSPIARTYQGSLTLRMSKQRGMAWFPTAPQPGTVAPAAPEAVTDQAAPQTQPAAGAPSGTQP